MSKKFPLPQTEGFSQVYQKGSNLIGIAVHLEPPVQRCLVSFWRFAVRTNRHLLPPFSATGLHHRSSPATRWCFPIHYGRAPGYPMDPNFGQLVPLAVAKSCQPSHARVFCSLRATGCSSSTSSALKPRLRLADASLVLFSAKNFTRASSLTPCRSSRVIGIPNTEQRYAVFNLSDGCRVGCDLMNLFFVFDETSDVSDAYETRHQADCIMDALNNPDKPRPAGEWIGGLITQQ